MAAAENSGNLNASPWRWFAPSFAVAFVALAICSLLYWWEARQLEQQLRDRQNASVNFFVRLLARDLEAASIDLQLLAQNDALNAYFENGRSEDLNRATVRASAFSREKLEYDQIRYLDETGRERIRINHRGEVVPKTELQDKSGRSFFVDSMALSPGDIHLSSLDLNIEHGQIEQPLKPTLRLSTPLEDGRSRRRGIMTINILGRAMLDRFAQFGSTNAHRLRVLNSQGYWLKARSGVDEWGFMFPARADSTLTKTDPDLWARLASTSEGQVRHGGGLFTWKRFEPARYVARSVNVVSADPFWILGSEVTAEEWAETLQAPRRTFLVAATLIVLLVVALGWFFRGRQIDRALFQRLFESAPSALFVVTRAGRILRANAMAETIFEQDRAALTGRPLASLLAESAEAARRELSAYFPKPQLRSAGEAIEAVAVRRVGGEFPVEILLSPLPVNRGTVSLVVVLDIADRKRAERVLQQSRDYAESIVATVRDPLLILTHDLRVNGANRAFHEIFQLGAAEVLNRPLAEIAEGAWADQRLLSKLENIVPQHTRLENYELTASFPKIGQRTFRLDARKLYRPGNNTTMTLLAMEDVTLRKQLEEVHAHFRALFENFPGPCLVLSPEFMVVAASNAYLEATMTSRSQLIGSDLFEVFPDNPDDHEATGSRNLRSSLQQVLRSAKPDTMAIQKYDIRRPDGTFEVRYWSPVNSPICRPDGSVAYIIHRAEDVTDYILRQKKEKMEQTESAELTRRMQALEAEVYQNAQQMQSMVRQLRVANEELEAFSYSVSHDLRAPLRHIEGFASMLKKHAQESLDDKGRRYLETISGSAQRMGALIDELLVFSRLGRTEMRQTEVRMTALVNEVIQDLQTEVNGRAVDWVIGDLPLAYGDTTLIRQVLANLIGNAVKYSRTREKARIEIGSHAEGDDYLVYWVKDNGVGFDMKYANKLFAVFSRLHSPKDFEGTGVGLANVRRIIVRHGGRVWAEAVVNEGATFFFTLQKPNAAAGDRVAKT